MTLLALLGALALGVGTIDPHPEGTTRHLLPGGLPDGLPSDVTPCAGCHLNPGLDMSARDADGTLHRYRIDADAYVASIHFRQDRQSCIQCHDGDYTSFPHAKDNPEPTCTGCHDDLKDEYRGIDGMMRQSVHAAGGAIAFDCATCHSPHSMRPAREMTVSERNKACVECHEDRHNPTGLSLAQRHAWHPQAALHLDRVACIACHTQPTGDDFSFRHNIRPKEEATSDCYVCHGEDSKLASYVGGFENGHSTQQTRQALVRTWYVSGGTSSPLLDRAGLGLMGLVLLGTLGHGTLRWMANSRRQP